jgi:hypothetical protein
VPPEPDVVAVEVEPEPDFAVTTEDHLPHSSVTFPFACPGPLSPENQ